LGGSEGPAPRIVVKAKGRSSWQPAVGFPLKLNAEHQDLTPQVEWLIWDSELTGGDAYITSGARAGRPD
jgi:hypothetical protein